MSASCCTQRTRNKQGLTPHDKDDFHRAKVPHAQSFALLDGKAEFADEHCAEEAYADGGRGGARAFQPVDIIHPRCIRDHSAVLYHVRKSEADGYKGDDGRQDEQRAAVPTTERRADDLDLQHK